MREPDFAAILLDALHMIHQGEGRTRSEGPLPEVVRDFDALHLCGGGASEESFRTAFRQAPWPATFGADGSFAGTKGGHALLADFGLRGLVIDLGQSSLKISTLDQRWIFPRDFQRLPFASEVGDRQRESQQATLRDFITESLRRCLTQSIPSIPSIASAAPASGVVLALPARLDDHCTPEACSYAGLTGNTAFVPDCLTAAGLNHVPTFILNDAELAALSARQELHPVSSRKTLVLTIGFGVGAALLTT
jgi:hypothetical protein